VTLRVLRAGVALDDADAVSAVAVAARVEPSTDPTAPGVSLDRSDVTQEIRSEPVTAAVSAVSAVPAVRRHLVAVQRAVIDGGGVVVEGRDIGTVVAPDAQVKVFLTADESVRAARRSRENDPAADAAGAARTQALLHRRDVADSTRPTSPLVRADDALVIDSSTLPVEAVVDRVLDAVRAAGG
jgi:cytidylate kinase